MWDTSVRVVGFTSLRIFRCIMAAHFDGRDGLTTLQTPLRFLLINLAATWALLAIPCFFSRLDHDCHWRSCSMTTTFLDRACSWVFTGGYIVTLLHHYFVTCTCVTFVRVVSVWLSQTPVCPVVCVTVNYSFYRVSVYTSLSDISIVVQLFNWVGFHWWCTCIFEKELLVFG